MSKATTPITSYFQKQRMLSQLQQEIDAMERDDKLKADMEFKRDFEQVLHKYNKSIDDVLAIYEAAEGDVLTTGYAGHTQATKSQPRKRALKVYKNPHTGEAVQCRGSNNKIVRGWKDKHGDEVVESWKTELEK